MGARAARGRPRRAPGPGAGADSRAVRARVAVLVGAGGMLGRAMAARLARRGWRCLSPAREELDLARPETIRRFAGGLARESPVCVINCAAWTDVDGAEAEETRATVVNGEATRHLLEALGGGGRLLTFGSDYVFDGRETRPYAVDHPRAPVNAYGRSKAAAEEVLESFPESRWLNVRTSWLYAPWDRNFVRTMAGLLREKPEVRVVADQRGRPTSAEHLARTSLALLERGATGHWHVTDGGACTWYELAAEIKRLTDARAHLVPCTSGELARPAPRPSYSVLDLGRTEALLGPMPHWKENLAGVVRRLGRGS